MFSQSAVSIQNVSKVYRLYRSPKERLLEAILPFKKRHYREFWALRDVSLEVPVGTTYGIVGRNGSGKSTLLQIVCGILSPSAGTVRTTGRIAALLELGSGFNPELTGRENAYLQGILMGFSRSVVKERLRLIQDFADIGEFFDQPVKTYSSGMFVRLAFSCAVNVDPDILVIDEALAVGDAKFQNKCYKKFRDFQEAGKTILFVTHDDQAVVNHCTKAAVLDGGRLICEDEPKKVIKVYYDILEGRHVDLGAGGRVEGQREQEKRLSGTPGGLDSFLAEVPPHDVCHLRASYNPECLAQRSELVEILDYLVVADGEVDPVVVRSGARMDLYVKVKFKTDLPKAYFGLAVRTKEGILVYSLNSAWLEIAHPSPSAGDVITVRFSMRLNLHAGDYFFDLGVDQPWDPAIGREPAYVGRKNSYVSLDRRLSIIHLMVRQKSEFFGIVDMKAEFECVEVQSVSAEAL